MPDRSIEKLLRSDYTPELPYGFAERVARIAMEPGHSPIWDFLLAMTPRTGLAMSAVAALLIVIGFSGSGPSVIDSVDHYHAYSSMLPLP